MLNILNNMSFHVDRDSYQNPISYSDIVQESMSEDEILAQAMHDEAANDLAFYVFVSEKGYTDIHAAKSMWADYSNPATSFDVMQRVRHAYNKLNEWKDKHFNNELLELPPIPGIDPSYPFLTAVVKGNHDDMDSDGHTTYNAPFNMEWYYDKVGMRGFKNRGNIGSPDYIFCPLGEEYAYERHVSHIPYLSSLPGIDPLYSGLILQPKPGPDSGQGLMLPPSQIRSASSWAAMMKPARLPGSASPLLIGSASSDMSASVSPSLASSAGRLSASVSPFLASYADRMSASVSPSLVRLASVSSQSSDTSAGSTRSKRRPYMTKRRLEEQYQQRREQMQEEALNHGIDLTDPEQVRELKTKPFLSDIYPKLAFLSHYVPLDSFLSTPIDDPDREDIKQRLAGRMRHSDPSPPIAVLPAPPPRRTPKPRDPKSSLPPASALIQGAGMPPASSDESDTRAELKRKMALRNLETNERSKRSIPADFLAAGNTDSSRRKLAPDPAGHSAASVSADDLFDFDADILDRLFDGI